MATLDIRTLLLWLGIVSLVILVTVTGMFINRFFTYRAHRRALAALKERSLAAAEAPVMTEAKQYIR